MGAKYEASPTENDVIIGLEKLRKVNTCFSRVSSYASSAHRTLFFLFLGVMTSCHTMPSCDPHVTPPCDLLSKVRLEYCLSLDGLFVALL